MKSSRWLSSCALALSLLPSLAVAGDSPPLVAQVQAQVDSALLKPLADLEAHTSRFSRMRPMPRERRLRVIDTTAERDKAGREFLAFAIDVKLGEQWRENDIVGCDYPSTASLFVKRGETYRPASFLLGKSAEPVLGVCSAAPPPPPPPRS